MITIAIPGWTNLAIESIVLDLNGSLTQVGQLPRGIRSRMRRLSEQAALFVLTADTRGNARTLLQGLPVELRILTTGNENQEKADFVRSLSREKVAYFGNGANDELAMQAAGLSICIVGKEGAFTKTALEAHLLIPTINDGLELLLEPERLVATLRK